MHINYGIKYDIRFNSSES